MNAQTLNFLSWAREQHANGLDQLGQDTVATTQEAISDPYPPASAPFTPPHRRTGNLREGVSSEVDVTEAGVAVTIVSRRAGGDERVPFWLEFGTSRMAARPYMRPQRDGIIASGISGIVRYLRS